MPDDPKNLGPGDSVVSLCNVISTNGKQLKDISPKGWNTIVFTESMGLLGDTPFISGEIVILDAINLLNELALHGDEVVELTFKTPQKKEIEFVGKVYQIDVSEFETSRTVSLKFCSAEKVVADQLKFNRAYREVLYSDMAQDIFAPLNKIGNKKIYVEPTKNKGSFIVNNQSPLDALNDIVKVARSESYMGANYVFFEQSDGIFQFVSIEKLVDPSIVQPTMKYYYDAPSSDLKSPTGLVRLKNYKIISMPNIVSNIERGMYAGTVISNDLLKRQINYTTFNYNESYNNYKSVNYNEVGGFGQGKTALLNNENYSQRSQGFVYFLPKHFKSFDTETNHGDEREDTMLVRNSQLQQINAIKLQIVVPGDSQRRVGEVIEVNLPAIEEKNDQGGGRLDMTFSGRYLVTKVKHMITSKAGGYETIMMITKDSYANPLPEKVI